MLWLVLQVLFYILVSLNYLNASEITNPAFNSSYNLENVFIHNVQPLKDAETINWDILKAAVRQKLREIFAIQFPNGKYGTRYYDIENWPEGINLQRSNLWRKDELVRINAGIPFYKFVRRAGPTYPAFNSSENQEILFVHNVQPLEDAVTLNLPLLLSSVRHKLREIFTIQFPGSKYDTGAYDIENWPPGIELHGKIFWRKDELVRINAGIPFYKFVKREEALKVDSYCKKLNEKLKNMECLKTATIKENCVQNQLSRSKSMKLILDRFKVESGKLDATSIDWRLSDRKQIPPKYKDVPLNTSYFRDSLIYRNPEIVDNIHFFKYSNLNFNNQFSDYGSTPSDDEVDVSEEAENFDEQKDICGCDDKKSDVIKFASNDELKIDIQLPNFEENSSHEFEMDTKLPSLAETQKDIGFDIINHELCRTAEYDFKEINSETHEIEIVENFNSNNETFSTDDGLEHTSSEAKTVPDKDNFDHHDDFMPENDKRIINHSPKLQKSLNYHDMEITDSVFDAIPQTLNENAANFEVDTECVSENSANFEVDTECVSENENQFKPDVHSVHQDKVFKRRDFDISNSAKNQEIEISFIHNVQPFENAEKINATVLLPGVRQKLREIFAIQFPNGKFNARNYDIENWPQGIELHGTKLWRKDELVRINERIPFYKFVPRKEAFKGDSYCKKLNDKLKNMECIKNAAINVNNVHYKMSKNQIMKFMLDRFKIESGKTDATIIDWRLFDRRQIPMRYKDVPLNASHFLIPLVYRNPEIVDNIHFFKYANLNDNDQTSDSERSLKDKGVDAADEAKDFDEQRDVCHCDDKRSDVIKSASIQLPNSEEKQNDIDIGININTRVIEKLYETAYLNENVEILNDKCDELEMDSQSPSLAETQKDIGFDIINHELCKTDEYKFKEINNETHEKEIFDGINLNDNIEILAKSDRIEHTSSEGHLAEFDFLETAPDLDIFDYSDDSMTGIDMNIYQTHNPRTSSNDYDMEISDSGFDTECVSENSNQATPNVQSNLNPKPTNLTLPNGIHEQQGNVNSRLIDISNSERHDDMFKGRYYEIGDRQEVPFVHNVQPLKDAVTLNRNILRAAVRQKLREIFTIQFPDGKYDIRKYDIENWPEGIKLHGAVNWRKDELVRINERIPLYKFIPREVAAKVDSAVKIIRDKLNNMECLRNAKIKNNQMSRIQIMQLMLDKFRLESGRTYAASIDWGLLDQRQIPLKYKDVPLNTSHFRISLIYRNAEIVDNIHFFKNANLNDNNQTSENEISPRDDEVVAECADPFNEQIDICFSEEEDDDESINIGEFEIDDQLSLFDEVPSEIGFDIKRRDLEKIFDFASFDDCHSKQSDSLVPNLEFNMNPDLKCKSNMFEVRNIVRHDLNRLFKIQFPDEEFKMSHYEIRNWPEGVGSIWNRWKKAEIKKIYEKMSEFVFVKRTHKLPSKPSKGIRQSGCLIGILDNSMTYEGTCETLLNRFRQESGRSNAVKIDWKLFDRRDIPAKYDGFVFHNQKISLQSFYKNPEIVNNIHFFTANELEKVSHKRKSEELEIDLPQSESSAQKKNRFRYDDYDDEEDDDD